MKSHKPEKGCAIFFELLNVTFVFTKKKLV